MLASSVTAIRLTLHVLAATIWVGGQIVMLGQVRAVKSLGPEASEAITKAFDRMAWPAYAVLVITGFWNISTFRWSYESFAWKAVLIAKIVVVALAGLGALLHSRATSKAGLAIWGSVAGLASVAALAMGILLAG